jgi:hypothetical protein
MAVGYGHLCVFLVIKTASEHLFCEGHYIRRISEIPLLVQPKGASRAHTCLDLIDNEVDAQFLCNILDTLGELSGDVIVATF